MDTNNHELISDLRPLTSELVSIGVYSWLKMPLLCYLSFLLLAIFATPLRAQLSSGGGGSYISTAGAVPAKPKPKPTPTPTPPPVVDGESDWNNTSTAWSTGTNWTGVAGGSAPPAAGDVAWFKVIKGTDPKLTTASVSIAGLYFSSTASSGYSITRTSPFAFTLTGSATSIGAETSDATAVAIGANNTSGTNSISVAIALAPAGGATTSTFFQAAGGTLDLSSTISVISGSGISLSLIGGGTFIFGGASTYNGGTTLSDGTLVLAASSNAGTTLTTGPVGTGTFHLGSGTNLVTLQASTAVGTPKTLRNSISLEGDVTFSPGPGQTTGRVTLDPFTGLTTPGTFTLARTNQLTVATGETVDFIGPITGAGFGITKLGAGTLNIGNGAGDTGANTFNGLTTVSAGSVVLNKAASTTAIAGDLTIDGTGTVSLSANEQIADTSSVTISSSSSAAFSLGSRTETIANLTINGVTGTNAVTGGSGTLIIAGAGTINANAGNITVTNLTTGTGGLSMGSGVTVSSSTAGGVTTLNGNVTFNGATTGATLGSTSAPSSGITLNGDRNFTVADATAVNDLTVAGVVSNGTVAGSGLTKLGAGTLVLSGANTYTGTTTVNAGTLLVNGSTAAASAVSVNNAGSVLGGTGTINGSVTISSTAAGATLNPGPSGTNGTAASVGTLNVGSLTLSPTNASTVHIDAFGTATSSWDKLVSAGAISLNTLGTLDVTIASGLTFAAGTTYVLLDGTSISGTFAGIADNQLVTFSGYTFIADYTPTGEFDLIAVPEPSTWIAGGLAFAALLISQRRRLKKLAVSS
jgi:fibronectin-binding autotransporter adhesin